MILRAAVLLLFAPAVAAGSFETCALDTLPGIQNDVAAAAAIQLCIERHGAKIYSGVQGAGRGVFSRYSSSSECILHKSKSTQSSRAVWVIAGACRWLYDKPAAPVPEN